MAVTHATYDPSHRQLRSFHTTDYIIPRTQFSDGELSIDGPTVWNTLPESVRNAPSVHSFKWRLKTRYFNLLTSNWFILLFSLFLQRSAKLALQALYVLRQIRPSVRHTPVLCQNEGTQRDAVFTVE